MKVSVITDEISSDRETAIELASEWGIRHVEIRGLWDKRVPDITPKQLERLKNILDRYEVDVVAISPGVFKVRIDDEGAIRQHLMNRLPESIDLAENLGTRIIVIFGFISDGVRDEEAFDRAVNLLRQASDYAAKRDVILALENEPICIADTGKRAAEIVNAVNRENLLINWDPCNAYTSGEKPFPDGYRHVRNLMVHFHLKDGVISGCGGERKVRYVPPGEGEIKVLEQIEALKRDGYEGFISIETHFSPRVKGTYRCWAALKEMLKRIGEDIE